MFCSNCGSVVPEKAQFCSSCGTKVDVEVEELIVDQLNDEEVHVVDVQPSTTELESASNSVSIDHAPQQQIEVAAVATATKQEEAPTAQEAKLSFLRKPLPLGIALGVVVIILIAVILMFRQSGGDDPVVFLGKNELLLQSKELNQPISLSGNIIDEWEDLDNYSTVDSRYLINLLVKLNEDKNKLFFIDRIREDDTASIYYRDLTKKLDSWDGDEGIKLASGVTPVNDKTFTISDNGKIVLYLKGYEYGDGGKLYYHDLTDETIIDSRVTNYWLSDNQSLIYYTKADDNGDENLYQVDINKLEDKAKVDSNIYSVEQFDKETGSIYYSKNDEDKNINPYTLYKKTIADDKVKLLSDYNSLLSNIENDGYYYILAEDRKISLTSLVNDDLALQDASVVEPEYSTYQTIVQTPYKDWWTGETYYSDETHTDYDAYNIAYNEYINKLSRDQLRQNLSERTINDVSYSLHLLSGGQSTKITDEYNSTSHYNVSAKTVLYTKNNRKSMDKILLSTLANVEEVEETYYNQVLRSPIIYMASGAVLDNEFMDEDTQIYNVVMSTDGKILYGIETTESSSELVSYNITDGKPTNRTKIDDEVDSYTYLAEESQLYYYKEPHNGSAELYRFKDDKTKRIAIDVRVGSVSYYPADDTLFYLTDYYEKDGTGTLFQYKKDEATKIGNEIGAYFYSASSKLYYLENFNADKGYGDLVEYVEKGKAKPIYDRVYTMLPTNYWYEF